LARKQYRPTQLFSAENVYDRFLYQLNCFRQSSGNWKGERDYQFLSELLFSKSYVCFQR